MRLSPDRRRGGARRWLRREFSALVGGLLAAVPVWTAVADMVSDSPVTFPKQGALPAKFPPDQPSQEREKAEEGYYIFSSPQRSLEQIERIQVEMPKGDRVHANEYGEQILSKILMAFFQP